MRKTIQQQIDANRRMSLVFSAFIVLLLAALGACIVGIYDPQVWYYGALGASFLGFLLALVARYQGPGIMLSISGAREATHAEDQVLDNVAEEMALAAGIPKPKVYVIDDPSPNAFATGMDPAHAVVVFTTGIIQMLDRDELQGVMAHELSHVRNYDIRFMTTVSLVAGLIPMLAYALRNMIWFGGGDSDRDDNSNSSGIFALVGFILSLVAPLFTLLLQMAISRKREYLADASGAELTRYPEGLARALEKLDSDPLSMRNQNPATQHMFIVNPLHDGGASLFSTHPPTQDRIKALMGLMGTYGRTQAAGLAPPPVTALGHVPAAGYEDAPNLPEQHL